MANISSSVLYIKGLFERAGDANYLRQLAAAIIKRCTSLCQVDERQVEHRKVRQRRRPSWGKTNNERILPDSNKHVSSRFLVRAKLAPAFCCQWARARTNEGALPICLISRSWWLLAGCIEKAARPPVGKAKKKGGSDKKGHARQRMQPASKLDSLPGALMKRRKPRDGANSESTCHPVAVNLGMGWLRVCLRKAFDFVLAR